MSVRNTFIFEYPTAAVGTLSTSTSIENIQIEYQSLVHDNNLSEPVELSSSSKIEIGNLFYMFFQILCIINYIYI